MLLDLFMILYCLLFNNYAMHYGESVVAAFGISQKVVQIVELVGMGLYTGVILLIASAYSAGNQNRFSEKDRRISCRIFFDFISDSFLLPNKCD